MAFQLDLGKYQSFYVPLAIFAGCLVIAAAIYGSGGIRIGRGEEPEEASEEAPAVAGEETGLDAFAKCLTERGANLYAHKGCGACQNQKDLFGASFQYLNHIECADESGGWSEVCPQAGVSAVPTWIFKDESKAVGLQTLEALSEETGCPL